MLLKYINYHNGSHQRLRGHFTVAIVESQGEKNLILLHGNNSGAAQPAFLRSLISGFVVSF